MFAEFFNFICDCLGNVFEVMKKFILFDGFNYYNFCISIFAIPIFIKLIHFIMMIEDEEIHYNYTYNYSTQYDYQPKHAKKDKRGKRN